MSLVLSAKSRLFDVQEGMVRLDDLSRRLRNEPDQEFEEPLGQALILGATKERVSVLRVRNQPEGCLTNLRTESGHQLSAGSETQVLLWGDDGVVRWVPLNKIECGNTVLLRRGMLTHSQHFPYTRGVMRSGVGFDLNINTFLFMGLIGTSVYRDRRWCLLTSSPVQVSRVDQMAQDFGLPGFFKTATRFSRFSGIYQIDAGTPIEMVCWSKSHAFLRLVRKAPIEFQAAWAAGLTLQGGRWTMDALELELDQQEVADTLFAVLQNLGISSSLFETLNVYGHRRVKLSIDREPDQLRAEEVLWKDHKKSCTWQERHCGPAEPPKPLQALLDAIHLACPDLVLRGFADLQEATTEQIPDLVESPFWETVQWVTRPDITADIVQTLERDQKMRSVSLVVPVGFDCLVDFMFVR